MNLSLLQSTAGLTILLAMAFAFINGFHDSGNIVATVISSRALRPRYALLLIAVAEFVGPFALGTAVARTIGYDIVRPDVITIQALCAAMTGAIVWNLFTWWVGLPSSSSHALVGGLLGGAWAVGGLRSIQMAGLVKTLIALFLSPVLGLVVGWVVLRMTLSLAAGASPSINDFFRRIQVLTAFGLGVSHGSNDGQKSIGIMTLALLLDHQMEHFVVPLWVIALGAASIGLGSFFSSQRIIQTLGHKFYKIRPVHGFTTQISSAAVIAGAGLLGGPVSTTQVLSSSIIGAGAAQRVSMVRWAVVADVVWAWVLTIPAAGITAALIYQALMLLCK